MARGCCNKFTGCRARAGCLAAAARHRVWSYPTAARPNTCQLADAVGIAHRDCSCAPCVSPAAPACRCRGRSRGGRTAGSLRPRTGRRSRAPRAAQPPAASSVLQPLRPLPSPPPPSPPSAAVPARERRRRQCRQRRRSAVPDLVGVNVKRRQPAACPLASAATTVTAPLSAISLPPRPCSLRPPHAPPPSADANAAARAGCWRRRRWSSPGTQHSQEPAEHLVLDRATAAVAAAAAGIAGCAGGRKRCRLEGAAAGDRSPPWQVRAEPFTVLIACTH